MGNRTRKEWHEVKLAAEVGQFTVCTMQRSTGEYGESGNRAGVTAGQVGMVGTEMTGDLGERQVENLLNVN